MGKYSGVVIALVVTMLVPVLGQAQGESGQTGSSSQDVKVGDSLVLRRNSATFYSSPGVRDSDLLKSDLRSNGDRIIVTGMRTVSGKLWYKVRIGCDCLLAPGRPSMGKMPDSHGWVAATDVAPAPKAISAKPAPKPASNPRLLLRNDYRAQAEKYLLACAGQPDHIARINELKKKVEATVLFGGEDWYEASSQLMVAMGVRAGRCRER